MTLESNKDIQLLVLTSSFPRFIGDHAGIFVYELANALNKHNINTLVLAPLFIDQRFKYTKISEKMGNLEVHRFRYFYPVRYQRLYRDGGFVHNLRSSYLAKIQLPLFVAVQLYSTIKIIVSQKVDIIHTHWMMPQGFIGAIMYSIFKKPHILTVHAADVFTLKKMPFGRLFAHFIVMNSTKIFVVSNYVSQSLCDMLPKRAISEYSRKLEILPMGVNTEIYQKNSNAKEGTYPSGRDFIVLFLGRLNEKKGAIYLIKSMIELKPLAARLRLIICGDGPLRHDLEDFVRQHNLTELVEFKGFITNDQKNEYLSMADILVVPSIIMDSGETEGLPVVILEGLAAGKAIIASNVSGASDAIQDGYNGFLVEQKKPEQIAEKIMLLMNNLEIQRNIEMNALKSSLKYDWSNISRRYEVAIKEQH
ncbi:glycosyl transferase group 1 [Methanoculleus bourgensis MS2]|uniref:Glycosyl transferase group 1 n=2 Tax=Methanoculleus bourgensis TaxID=83986 RepID=I7KDM9_METBM|nr:glycosyltransferase [Methanoculleus bourgensis]CCJ37026.1 glycosyl transferase group 1 [Methanoculleus bourgensis MS2]